MPKEAGPITPDRIANICDRIATIEDSAKRAERVDRAASTYGVSAEAVQATFAHVKIRRNSAIKALRRISAERRRELKMAQEGCEQLTKESSQKMKMRGILVRKMDRLEALREGLFLLERATTDQDVIAVIEKFADEQDAEALGVLANIYRAKRPDIATEALLHAGTPEAALALAVEHQRAGHRRTFQQLLARVSEEVS